MSLPSLRIRIWAWADTILTTAHVLPDVRNFTTSGCGCYQSPSFRWPRDQKKRGLWEREWRATLWARAPGTIVLMAGALTWCENIFVSWRLLLDHFLFWFFPLWQKKKKQNKTKKHCIRGKLFCVYYSHRVELLYKYRYAWLGSNLL